MSAGTVTKAAGQVRDLMSELGKDMSRPDWKAFCEEVAADVDGNLDCIAEEELNDEDEEEAS